MIRLFVLDFFSSSKQPALAKQQEHITTQQQRHSETP